MSTATGFRHIVRVIDKDLDGTKTVVDALSDIKGVGIRLAQIIARRVGISPETRIGYLPEEKIEEIEDFIRSLSDRNVPDWLLNRRKDLETGKDKHLISSDIDLQVKADIEREKSIWSWRGYRHAYGLKVRGQRTRTTGRTGKTVGVSKKRR
ncbi:MAG: 30S ribosomal protein S13 [Candidatus Bathyarchaeia archaeon]|nr:30S ribosomal protein S13 [Candidatus Bathyarchaeota archaeon]